jgi:hypothetical protein
MRAGLAVFLCTRSQGDVWWRVVARYKGIALDLVAETVCRVDPYRESDWHVLITLRAYWRRAPCTVLVRRIPLMLSLIVILNSAD